MNEKERLLHIEDDILFRNLLARSLRMSNYEVEEAGDGAEGIRCVLEGTYDLVLLDMHLPDMTGIEILKEIRKVYSRNELPVIVLSGQDDSAEMVEALQEGANDYVCKPIDREVLVARIQANLQSHRGYEDSIKGEQARVMQETIGAACHHIAQPMTAAVAQVEMLVRESEENGSASLPELQSLREWIKRSGKEILRLQRVKEYRTVHYDSGIHILDVDGATDS